MSFVTFNQDVNCSVVSSRCYISCSRRSSRLRHLATVISSEPAALGFVNRWIRVWWRSVGRGLIKEARRWPVWEQMADLLQQSLQSHLHVEPRRKSRRSYAAAATLACV